MNQTTVGRFIYRILGSLICCLFPMLCLWVSTFPEEQNNKWFLYAAAVFTLVVSLLCVYVFVPIMSPVRLLTSLIMNSHVVELRSTGWLLWVVYIGIFSGFSTVWVFLGDLKTAREVLVAYFCFAAAFPLWYVTAKMIRKNRANPISIRFQHRRVEVRGPHAITLHGDDVEAVVLRDRLWRPMISIRFCNPDAPRPFSDYWVMHFLPFGPRELAELMAAHLEVPVEEFNRWSCCRRFRWHGWN